MHTVTMSSFMPSLVIYMDFRLKQKQRKRDAGYEALISLVKENISNVHIPIAVI